MLEEPLWTFYPGTDTHVGSACGDGLTISPSMIPASEPTPKPRTFPREQLERELAIVEERERQKAEAARRQARVWTGS